MNFSDLSIIIPVGLGDESWRKLIADLVPVSNQAEILLVGTTLESADHSVDLPKGVQWLQSKAGRAHQLNAGAAHSTRKQLWFLHADSQVTTEALQALSRSVDKAPEAVHYFDLEFSSHSPVLAILMKLNAWGVRVRSRILGLPFGDQGFSVSARTFGRLGGFSVTAPYGEDHLWIWKAHFEGIPLRPVPAKLITSARKYEKSGWARTTGLHLWLTARQAGPQWLRSLNARKKMRGLR